MSAPELRRVLLVDDDEDLSRIAFLALSRIGGLEVLVCGGGREALEKAAEFRPDLFVLDVMMPEMDGMETLRRLRATPGLEGVPAIFLTAKVQREEVDHYFAQGAIGVVSKPFDPLTLAGTIRETWGRHAGSAPA